MQRHHKVRITAIKRSEPDIRLLVLALIEAAREVQAQAAEKSESKDGGARHE